MAIKVNQKALRHAKRLIKEGSIAEDSDHWGKHAPTTAKQNRFIKEHGIAEFSKWYLGIDPSEDKDNKGTYSFPFGDFTKVHRDGVIAAKSRAAQFDHTAVKNAADELLRLIDGE